MFTVSCNRQSSPSISPTRSVGRRLPVVMDAMDLYAFLAVAIGTSVVSCASSLFNTHDSKQLYGCYCLIVKCRVLLLLLLRVKGWDM